MGAAGVYLLGERICAGVFAACFLWIGAEALPACETKNRVCGVTDFHLFIWYCLVAVSLRRDLL